VIFVNANEEPEEEYIRLKLPNRNKSEMFAIAERLMGGSRIHVVCADGKARLARISGRMKRRQRVRAGDLVISTVCIPLQVLRLHSQKSLINCYIE